VSLRAVMARQGRQSIWFARQMGVSQSLVNKWSKGERRMSPMQIKRAAEVLGVKEQEIQNGRRDS
jgi:DNA-binding transcriptional regulator YdaS (Cro superfamily)